MKATITRRVKRHNKNASYPCIKIEWVIGKDTNVMTDEFGGINWLPRDREIIIILRKFKELYGQEWLKAIYSTAKRESYITNDQKKLDF